MIATKPRRRAKKRTRPARPVTEILLELAYHLHATRAVARPPKNR